MMTFCIRYTLDAYKLADFEVYARVRSRPIERCGGKIARPTNTALGSIDFPDIAS